MKINIVALAIMLSISSTYAQKKVSCKSPNGQIKVQVDLGTQIKWSLMRNDTLLIAPSQISMILENGEVLGNQPKLIHSKSLSKKEVITSPFYKKREVKDFYTELSLAFSGGYALVFRVYNDGIAYRIETTRKDELKIRNEVAEFNLNQIDHAYVAWVSTTDTLNITNQFFNSFENVYARLPLKGFSTTRLAMLPLLTVAKGGINLCITEADVEDYPGMYLQNKDGSTKLTGVFAPYPKEVEQGGHNQLQLIVKSRESYIATVKGTRSFPWRIVTVTDDSGLADNDMVYRLASPSRLKDNSWIKPGKVAWDWWNDWNIYGVDFESGVNNATYKYYIDFAATFGLQYVILDEGWAVNQKADLMQVVPEIDIKELCDYAKKKGVGIILWAGMYAMEKDMEGICKHYASLGVKGFKVDFLDRDDQWMVNYCYRLAEIASKHKLLLDFHGVFKPTGLQRTYPNVLNFEGVFGMEQMKWTKLTTGMVDYDVTVPFIRMMAGPMDYTQGAMRNATKENFRAINTEAMSQGTRCRQLAQYVVYESPLSMLCDNPSNYYKEKESIEFIASVPTVWDETKVLSAKVGEYIVTARRQGNDWFIGGLTNWDARTTKIDMSFLAEGSYEVEMFVDGINAHRVAIDYTRTVFPLNTKSLDVKMSSGGGFAIHIKKK